MILMDLDEILDSFSFEDLLKELIDEETRMISETLGFSKPGFLVDVIDENEFLRVVVEMPVGVNKNEIKLYSNNSNLEITIRGITFSRIVLPSAVEKTCKAIFKNGIIEVMLKKIEKWRINLE